MKAYSSREFIKILRDDGWILKDVEGDHYQFVHPVKRGKIAVKHPTRGFSPWLLRKMFKDAGIEPPES